MIYNNKVKIILILCTLFHTFPVTLDVTRLFNNVLLQQTQYQDYHGNDTLTSIYTKWLEVYSKNRIVSERREIFALF